MALRRLSSAAAASTEESSAQHEADGAEPTNVGDDFGGPASILDTISWSTGKVLKHLEPALRALLARCELKVRDCLRAGPARILAVGTVGAATAVRLRADARVNGARKLHVWCALAWRARRAVLNLVKDRVRDSLHGSA